MSYDLTIWKWAGKATATPDEIFEAIGQDEAHPAMQRFDTKTFLKDLYSAFGGEERWSDDSFEAPFTMDVADFTGTPANWIILNAGYSRVKDVVSKLIQVCKRHDLVLFDHQTEALYEA
ncbi:MAG TPA: hypothetical protein VIM11_22350 [Tepidisphaeraceae bacterium]|jgi:hypothetical protein